MTKAGPRTGNYTGFDWDEGNSRKNEKHGVSKPEVEQVFLNAPLLVADDLKHSRGEPRFHALGRTDWIAGCTSLLRSAEIER